MRYGLFVFALCLPALFGSPTQAQRPSFQGLAAADTARSAGDVYVEGGFDKNGAMEHARAACALANNGSACKSIAAPPSNHFVVIACIDDGPHVHMAADNTVREAEGVARLNAAGFGRVRCRVIYQD